MWWRGVPDSVCTQDVQLKGEDPFKTEVERIPINTLEFEDRVSWPCAVAVLLWWDNANLRDAFLPLSRTFDKDQEWCRCLDGS